MSKSSSKISRRVFLGTAAAAAGASSLAAPRLAFGAKDTIKFQMGWVKSVQYGGFFAGLENGFFDAEGIEVDFMSGGPSIDPINVVAAGQALIGDRDSTSLILARAKGIPLQAFAQVYQISPYAVMTLKGKKIATGKDMEGKSISIFQGRRAALAALLKRQGVDSSKITFLPGGTDPGMLVSGQVDGYFGWYTNQGTMLTTKGVDIDYTTLHDLGDPTYPVSLFALEDTLTKQKDLLTRFVRAQQKSWKWYAENPEAVAKITVEKYGQKGLDLVQQTAEAKLTAPIITTGGAAQHGVMWIDRPFFEHGISIGKEAGVIQGEVKVEDVMTQDIVKAANGRA